ncbi:hypothetical protein QWJ46_15425 [Rhizobium sp. CBN3]|uniref:hypothetical protein n=1 Tax=Rhizobium sp. CBN3 TaxID=3058045 RepID=UPI002673F3BC|nr:hypothetical protein [Rhizobium sp. CBN3]MDO3434075.1 hypothetical protein [Rhizobium sp. CBN3]
MKLDRKGGPRVALFFWLLRFDPLRTILCRAARQPTSKLSSSLRHRLFSIPENGWRRSDHGVVCCAPSGENVFEVPKTAILAAFPAKRPGGMREPLENSGRTVSEKGIAVCLKAPINPRSN